jgi:hypothetical protein
MNHYLIATSLILRNNSLLILKLFIYLFIHHTQVVIQSNHEKCEHALPIYFSLHI